MKAMARFEFNNGETFICNLKGRGCGDLINKCNAIANRLEKPSIRELKRWELFHDKPMTGRSYVRVNNAHHVSGIVYLVIGDGSVIKELR